MFGGVTEPVSRQKSGRAAVKLSDLTLIVRPAGKPAEIRSFTDAERGEAEQYAGQMDASVETLPL